MSTDELSRTVSPADDQQTVARRPLFRSASTRSALKGLVPLALLTVIFIGYAVPPYLTLDPTQARIQPMPPHASYYPLLVTHIFLGSVALLAGCLQVWPWLRRSRPVIHRVSGRIYVAAALTASICVMIISPMGLHGAINEWRTPCSPCCGSGQRWLGFEPSASTVLPITGGGCCAASRLPFRLWPSGSGCSSSLLSSSRRLSLAERSIWLLWTRRSG